MEKKEIVKDEALKEVTGGAAVTYMLCTECGQSCTWSGGFKGRAFDCPFCGAKGALLGRETHVSPEWESHVL